MNKDETAIALLNEAKSLGLYDKANPENEQDRYALAQDFYNKAKKHRDKGSKDSRVASIAAMGDNLGFGISEDDPDEKRYKTLVMEEIDGLPNPFKPENETEVLPFVLEQLNVKEIMRYTGIYNSYFGYANHKYSLEEAGESAAKIIADEAYDQWLVKAPKKDEETNKAKTAKQLEAEAFVEDERYSKWRTKQKEHSVRAKRYKRLKDIYFENCERLSRAFSAIQDERKYTNG